MWLRPSAIAIVCLALAGYVSAQTFVQVATAPATVQASNSIIAATVSSPQVAGHLNVVAVGWGDATSVINSVVDTRGNTYTLILGPTRFSGLSQSLYYAKNIAAGSNTITVTFNQSASFPDMRVTEYAGLDTTAPLDQWVGASGTGTLADSTTELTSVPNELIFGSGTTGAAFTAAGSGFTSRLVNAFGNIVEDKTVTSTGTYNATATTSSSNWIMQMATFKVASGTPIAHPVALADQGCTLDTLNPNKGGKHPQLSELRAATLAWSGAADWFRVYRSTTSGGPYTLLQDCIRATTYTDNAVSDEQVWFYVVTGVTGGVETTNSNESSGAIPPQSLAARTQGPLHRAISDSLTTSGVVADNQVLRRSIADSVAGVSDAVTGIRTPAHNILLSEPLLTSDLLSVAAPHARSASITQSVSSSDAIARSQVTGRAPTESLTTTATLQLAHSPALSQSLTTSDSLARREVALRTFAEVLSTNDSLTVSGRPGTISESFATIGAVVAQAVHPRGISSTQTTIDSVAARRPLSFFAFTETLSTADAVAGMKNASGPVLTENLTTSAAVTTRRALHITIADAVTTSDALVRHVTLNRNLADSFATNAAVSGLKPTAVKTIYSGGAVYSGTSQTH